MCTVVLLRRPGHEWPLLLAANRDERIDRPWDPPARHWPDRADVIAGRDQEAGGTWLGMNDHGVVAAILNRTGSLGPAADKRSRGELVLDALDFAAARDAAEALAEIDASAYRSFNLVIADREHAFWLKGEGHGAPVASPAPDGVSVLTAHDLNDVSASPRARHYLPIFETMAPPAPENDDWASWEALLASRAMAPGQTDANAAIHVETDWGFGTVSSSLIGLPADLEVKPLWRFAKAWPEREEYIHIPT
ncbi:MAG: NRDE family protein [Alphaproteobacteria bacterium]|jgi:uncharacterized protein with NRDE domain